MDERSATDDRFTESELPRRLGSPQWQSHHGAPHRTWSKGPVVLTGVVGLVLGLVIGYGVGHGAKSGASSGSVTATTHAPLSGPAGGAHASSGAAAAASAKVGGSIALTGLSGEEKISVTLVKVADPATSSDQYTRPGAGKRWVAVQIRVTNTAATAYSDSPANGATLVDAQGRHYSSTFGDTTLGQAMDSEVKLAPGDSALGVVVYEVPSGQKVSEFQFSLDSGFADQTGRWRLS